MRRTMKNVAAVLAVLLALSRTAGSAPLNDLTGTVADLQKVSQDVSAYVQEPPETRWLPENVQDRQAQLSLEKFFSPWDSLADSGLSAEWGAQDTKEPVWGENLLPVDEARRSALAADADMDSFPTMQRFAIAVVDAPSRALPTLRPFFADPGKAGEGFPFDYLQIMTFYAGSPLKVLHANRRGDWYLCQSDAIPGWTPASQVAFVDDNFMRAYRTGRYAAITRDETPLRSAKGRTLLVAGVGSIFPLAEATKSVLTVLVPLRKSDGTAEIARCIVAAGSAQPLPVPLTPGNIAAQANRFIGRLYGWGGMYGNRDCSQFMRDLFFPFGIRLPRNSEQQARQSGFFIDLSEKSNGEKLQIIREKALPFRSLIGMKGHVALFVGLNGQGEPLILHNFWGVRIGSPEAGTEGRAVIGRTAVTTLHPGIERGDTAPEGLLPKVVTLTFLPGITPE